MNKGFRLQVRILDQLVQVEVFETRWQAEQFEKLVLQNLSHQLVTVSIIDERG